jgi:tetratricopeptide (TPR) repeat protein
MAQFTMKCPFNNCRMRGIFVCLLWFSIGCGTSNVLAFHLIAQQRAGRTTEELLHQLVTMLQSKDFDGALTVSSAALRQTPNDYRVWTLRGIAFSSLHNASSAQTSFQHALKLAPFYLPALEAEAQLKYEEGDDSARPILLRVLTISPDDQTTHEMLGVLDFKRNDCTGAVSHFSHAQESLSVQPEGLQMYGQCLAFLGRYEEAIPVFQRELTSGSGHRVRYMLALCQWGLGRTKDALETLEPTLRGVPGDEKNLELAADIYESENDTQHAIDLLRKAILENPKDPDPYLRFAQLTYDHGSPKIGIDFLNAGLTQQPQEARFYLVRGVLLCQLGEFQKASDDFQSANRLNPGLSYVDVAKGIAESQVHKPVQALEQFRNAARDHPNEALTQYLLAEALSEQENPDTLEVLRAAKQAIQLDPKLVAAHDLLAGIYLQDGKRQLAIEHSQAALSVDANDQQALYHLILALRDTDRKKEIPALMKRMTDLRQAARVENGPQRRLHQLSELSDSP